MTDSHDRCAVVTGGASGIDQAHIASDQAWSLPGQTPVVDGGHERG